MIFNSSLVIIECNIGNTITMTPELKEKIDNLLQENKILVFMKGNKLMPQCGFSNNVVQILNTLGVPFETVDVLSDSEIRQGIKEYSNWPTIPQVYINGEFLGGSDILIELYQKGELQQKVEVALAS
ncbi:monothiol glutaredoxin [Nostoc sp. 'Peltigera membranacea cyanobiont' N6]|nr:monothiol glutaredoxin [Nostoc sp. 'Peltigera membranacea cyanobiont' N6]